MNERNDFDGLSVRTKNCLLSEGLLCMDDVRAYVINSDLGLEELKKIPNFGKVSFAEILPLINLGSQADIDHKKKIDRYILFLKSEGYRVLKEV
jgi:DNA-directed RNA polymerase alpha subunit